MDKVNIRNILKGVSNLVEVSVKSFSSSLFGALLSSLH